MDHDRPAKTLVRWFSTQATGCAFASSFAKQGIEGRISFSTFAAPDCDDLVIIDGHLEACGRESRAACLVFPNADSDERFAELLNLLGSGERWRIHEHGRDDRGVFVIVEWRTEEGHWSRTMGLAPILCMPATRRTPYVALALWPGLPRRPKDWVGFIDMPSGLEQAAHDKAIETSTAAAAEIMGKDRGNHWRDVAFRLPSATFSLLTELTT